jgi:hypothetical protein
MEGGTVDYLVNELVPLPRRLSPGKPTCGVVRSVNHDGAFGRYAEVEVARELHVISFEELEAATASHLRRLGVA